DRTEGHKMAQIDSEPGGLPGFGFRTSCRRQAVRAPLRQSSALRAQSDGADGARYLVDVCQRCLLLGRTASTVARLRSWWPLPVAMWIAEASRSIACGNPPSATQPYPTPR